jgi:glycosyltransferase involved in cell wall biosynthesis
MLSLASRTSESASLPGPSQGEARLLQGRRVLEICRVAFLGGAERIALDSARAVRAAGGDVLVACPSGGQMEAATREAGIESLPLRALGGRLGLAADLARAVRATASNRRILAELAARQSVDLIHAHHPIGAFQAAQAAGADRARLVLHVHETLPAPRQYVALGGWLRRRCDAFVCVSEAGRDLIRRLGVAENRIHLVYNAAAPHFFEGAQPIDLGPGPHVGVFGVLEPRKGQADLIAAFAALSGRHPTAQLWIVGELSYAANAGYAAELRALADHPQLRDRVHFLGRREDVAELMTAMNVVALPSRGLESLPTVLLEAAALGRVCVATAVGGVPEILEQGRTGYVVAPGDRMGLGQALCAALAPEAAAVGRAARRMARDRFSPARFEQDLLGVFGDLLNAPRTRF